MAITPCLGRAKRTGTETETGNGAGTGLRLEPAGVPHTDLDIDDDLAPAAM